MTPNELELESPLWSFSLKRYPEIESELLELQRVGVRVNYLLLGIWLGEQGAKLEKPVLAADLWFDQYTAPLRGMRYELRDSVQSHPELTSAYESLKASELKLEQIELALLYAEYSGPLNTEKIGVGSLVRQNILWVLSQFQVDDVLTRAQRLLAKLGV